MKRIFSSVTFVIVALITSSSALAIDLDAEFATTLKKTQPPCVENLNAALSKPPFSKLRVESIQPSPQIIDRKTGACRPVEGLNQKAKVCLSSEFKVQNIKKSPNNETVGLSGEINGCSFTLGFVSGDSGGSRLFEDAILSNSACKNAFLTEFADYQRHPYVLKSAPQIQYAHAFAKADSKFQALFDFESNSARATANVTYSRRRPHATYIRTDYKFAVAQYLEPDKAFFMMSDLTKENLDVAAVFKCQSAEAKVRGIAQLLLSARN